MNLNNFLCSRFKPNKDGKVTIGHVADSTLKISIILAVLCLSTLWIGGVFIYLNEINGMISDSDLPQCVVDGEIIGSCMFFFLVGLLLILLIVVIIAATILAAFIINRICSIPIASCGIVEENNDKKLIECKEDKDEDDTGKIIT